MTAESFMFPGEAPNQPEIALGELTHAAELRLGEALARRQSDESLVWVLGGTDPRTHEEVVWFRLGQSEEIGEQGQERLTIGIVVSDHAAEVPAPISLGDASAHFYVAQSVKGAPKISRIDINKAERAMLPQYRWQIGARQQDDPKNRSLKWKIDNYKVHPFRTKTQTGPGIDDLTDLWV